MKLELVKNWIAHDVITITPETTLPEVHKLMADYRIRRLPVVNNGHLIGIITESDIFRIVVQAWREVSTDNVM